VDKPRLSVSLGLWQDRPAAEVVRTAEAADALGYGEIWIGEMATFDAFALGAVVAERTSRAELTIGPLAVAVRDPVMIAMGAGSLAELTGRTVNVALGSSSPVVVERWHGRRQERTALALAESAAAVRTLLAGGKADVRGEVISTRGFRLRTRAPGTPLTIAAFGRGAVRVAARQADRMVINLVTPKSAARLVQMLHDECRAAGRAVPPVAVWLAAVAVPDGGAPDTQALEQLRRGLVAYLSAPGYGEMFAEAGFGEVVRFARTGPHPGELLAAIPAEVVGHVSLTGGERAVRARLAEYADAGVDEVALVPASSDADPAGVATLAALAPSS
jgi:probable F420-dependent oxidoreductase